MSFKKISSRYDKELKEWLEQFEADRMTDVQALPQANPGSTCYVKETGKTVTVADNGVWGGSSGGGVTSWNDLEDKPFGVMEAYLLPETTLALVESGGMMVAEMSLTSQLEANNAYTVNVDGVDYACECTLAEDFGFKAMGNMAAFGGDDTGEPFLIMDTGPQVAFVSLAGATSVTASIRGVATVSLPVEYTPEPVFVDLIKLGVDAVGVSQNTISMTQVDVEQFNTAFRNGLIKIRLLVNAPLRDQLAVGTAGLSNIGGAFEFVAPVKKFDGEYIVETTLFDSAIFINVQYDGILRASMFKMAMYDFAANNILPGK